jgi:hypothetical protein
MTARSVAEAAAVWWVGLDDGQRQSWPHDLMIPVKERLANVRVRVSQVNGKDDTKKKQAVTHAVNRTAVSLKSAAKSNATQGAASADGEGDDSGSESGWT